MTRVQQPLTYRILIPNAAGQVSEQEVVAPPRARRWLSRFVLAFIVTVAGSYLVVELLGLRYYQTFGWAPMQKLTYFQSQVRAPAVVYMGNSQLMYGVMPEIVADEAARRGRPLPNLGYNLSVPACGMESNYFFLRDLLKGDLKPEAVVFGACSNILDVLEREEAERIVNYGHLRDVWKAVRMRRLPPTALAAESFRGLRTLWQLPLYPWREELHPGGPTFRWEHLRRGQGGWWLPEDIANAEPTDRATWDKVLRRHTEPRPMSFDDLSFPAGHLLKMRGLARERGIRFVVIYAPRHDDYYRLKLSREGEAAFRAWMPDFCRRHGIEYHDLHELGRYEDGDYLDFAHLNARGAEKLSRRIAEVLASPTR